MTKQSTTQRVRTLAARLKDLREADTKNDVIDAVKDSLAVHAPYGDPSAIEAAGNRYKTASSDSDHLRQAVATIAGSGLPDVWTGSTGAKAAEVVAATTRALDHQTTVLHNGGVALHNLADALRGAQSQDTAARTALQQVLSQLGGREGWFDEWFEDGDDEAKRKQAQQAAIPHVEALLDAAKKADTAARAAARDLNKAAAQARAGKMNTTGVTAADKVVLAETATPDGPTDLNSLLSATDLRRSGEYMEKMNPTDRASFDLMLANASNPQERAYLVKALAAGHNLGEIRDFQAKIHGKDPEWLRAHLTPVYTKTSDLSDGGVRDDGSNWNTVDVNFGSAEWKQTGGTCVASSTVTARATVDPLYALALTGGPSGQENDPAAFQKRLLDEQHRVHKEGDGGDGWSGMDDDGQKHVLNREVSPHTGAEYEHRKLADDDARREILPEIEKAVAEGKPVPIGVKGESHDGKHHEHAVMIVGQQGDKLQIYNPWGTTTWVSEADFVNGNMGRASAYYLNQAYDVDLPK